MERGSIWGFGIVREQDQDRGPVERAGPTANTDTRLRSLRGMFGDSRLAQQLRSTDFRRILETAYH
jgi:hypothetical protein